MDDVILEFIAETCEGLEALDSELVRFEQCPDDPQVLGGIFRLIHTIKGTCGFLGLTRLQTVAHAAENVLGAFRDGELGVTPQAVSAVLETVDLIRAIVQALGEHGVEPAGDDSDLIARLDGIMIPGAEQGAVTDAPPASAARPLIERLGGDATLDAACEIIVPQIFEGAAATFSALDPDMVQFGLRDAVVGAARGSVQPSDFARQLAGIAPGADAPAVQALIRERLSEALAALDIDAAAIADLSACMTVPVPAAAGPSLEPSEPPPVLQGVDSDRGQGPQTIRVNVDALEHLMTVASELVLIRNQLIQTLRLDPDSPFAGPLNRLNQVTTELQEGVMTTRMQPISGGWTKLPRLIRDLSRELGKEIDLVMEGQDTELDRQVLELIKDPLTHMIRNAADHGLEDPVTRRAAGKSATGRIHLAARHEGGSIVIEVSDDGRGLSVERIRAKAVASGLVSAAKAETLSDAEVRQFIFAAGFSTAGQVTAVSGRGVGMDVVRTNIEKIGGVIDLHSLEGRGTTFSICIPLTLTIVSALIVECCGQRFALPQSAVTELVSAGDAGGRAIEHINGAAVLRLRNRLLPLVSLEGLLRLEPGDTLAEETCIVVVRLGSFSFGVIVERIFDTEEIVVKPVSSVLRHLRVYSGATILGDGSVILILDPKGLSAQAGAIQSHADEPAASTPGEQEAARSSILVFREAGGAIKATPLSTVGRIEEVEAKDLEQVDGRAVLQYRGGLMPVVGSDGATPAVWSDGRRRPLLVFNRDERSVGLLVEEIVDIIECAAAINLEPCGEGSAGSLIINGSATEMIDVDHYWRVGLRGRSTPAAPAEPRRILVIDQSPLSQVLLKPLLIKAGYTVTVVDEPEAALKLHDQGLCFDIIMADTGGMGQRLAALGRASAWQATPLMGLERSVLADLSAGETPEVFEPLRGAA